MEYGNFTTCPGCLKSIQDEDLEIFIKNYFDEYVDRKKVPPEVMFDLANALDNKKRAENAKYKSKNAMTPDEAPRI